MSLVALNASKDGYEIDLKYASNDNVTGKSIYSNALPYLHQKAYDALLQARTLAKALGYRFKIYDVFRPPSAQKVLWDFCPDDNFITPPEVGSPHSRGVAIDLTLLDSEGNELEMGTPFDDFTVASYHKCTTISIEAQKNRFLLCGLMKLSGWDHTPCEWWHYHLPNHETYPLFTNEAICGKIME